MTGFDRPAGDVTISSSTTPTMTRLPDGGPGNRPEAPGYKSYPTDTIAAVTIAVLAVVIILTLFLVIRALRKRRQARQGEQFDHVPTLTTGIMGTAGSPYVNSLHSVGVRGQVSWETVNPSVGNQPEEAASSSR